MAFFKGKVELDFYNDSTDTEFPDVNVPSIKRSFKAATAAEAQTTVVSLAALGTQAISLNGLDSIDGVYIYSQSTSITVDINGLGNITLAAGRPSVLFGTVTSLSITNTSASTATTVEVMLVKES